MLIVVKLDAHDKICQRDARSVVQPKLETRQVTRPPYSKNEVPPQAVPEPRVKRVARCI